MVAAHDGGIRWCVCVCLCDVCAICVFKLLWSTEPSVCLFFGLWLFTCDLIPLSLSVFFHSLVYVYNQISVNILPLLLTTFACWAGWSISVEASRFHYHILDNSHRRQCLFTVPRGVAVGWAAITTFNVLITRSQFAKKWYVTISRSNFNANLPGNGRWFHFGSSRCKFLGKLHHIFVFSSVCSMCCYRAWLSLFKQAARICIRRRTTQQEKKNKNRLYIAIIWTFICTASWAVFFYLELN